MNKYTRSIEKLTVLLKDIFCVPGISDDTKAIALVLAATMSASKYKAFVEPLEELGPLKTQLCMVNSLRCHYGKMFRDYIIMYVLIQTKNEVKSDELQRYISKAVVEEPKRHFTELGPALSTAEIKLGDPVAWQDQTNEQDFTMILQNAANFLVNKLTSSTDQIATIIETYVHCRTKTKPIVAYYATMHAIEHILAASGVDNTESLQCSYKLAKHALDKFIHDSTTKNQILPIYDSFATTSS